MLELLRHACHEDAPVRIDRIRKHVRNEKNMHYRPRTTQSYVASYAFTIRVKSCRESYEILKERGAEFITAPYDWGAEIRCFFQDPDGNLFEISEV